MSKTSNDSLSDLVLNRCPLGCANCTGIWINQITNHRIVCKCECKHKKTLAQVWDPEANAIVESSSSPVGTEENGIQ
ncbi:MAG: hypothetical protein ACRD8W_01625 [Nitrososphaeraceae archaeon]